MRLSLRYLTASLIMICTLNSKYILASAFMPELSHTNITTDLINLGEKGDIIAQEELALLYFKQLAPVTCKGCRLVPDMSMISKNTEYSDALEKAAYWGNVAAKRRGPYGEFVTATLNASTNSPLTSKEAYLAGLKALEESMNMGFIPAMYALLEIANYNGDGVRLSRYKSLSLDFISKANANQLMDIAVCGITLHRSKSDNDWIGMMYIGEALERCAKSNAKGVDAVLYLLGASQAKGIYGNVVRQGKPCSMDQSVSYIKDAAGRGNIPAMLWLGKYYENDAIDYPKAFGWYTMAAQKGDETAKESLTRIESKVPKDNKVSGDNVNMAILELKEKADKHKEETLVFKGFYLGMDVNDAAVLLTQYMKARPKKDVSKELDSASDSNDPAQMMAAMESMSMALVDGLTGANPQEYEVTAASNGEKVVKDGNRAIFTAGKDGKVIEFFLPPKILSVLFNVDFKAVSSDKFLETFRSSYGLGSFKSDTEKVVVMTSEEGFNELKRYESDKGFSVLFYDESSHVIGDKKAMELKVMGMGNVYDKNTMIIRAVAPKAQMESSFD